MAGEPASVLSCRLLKYDESRDLQIRTGGGTKGGGVF